MDARAAFRPQVFANVRLLLVDLRAGQLLAERRLAEALLQYTQDYDGHGPSAGAWCDQLLPGLGDEKPFACPTAHSVPGAPPRSHHTLEP